MGDRPRASRPSNMIALYDYLICLLKSCLVLCTPDLFYEYYIVMLICSWSTLSNGAARDLKSEHKMLCPYRPLQMRSYKVGNGMGLPKGPFRAHHAPFEMQKG